MANLTPQEKFERHWNKIRSDEEAIGLQSIAKLQQELRRRAINPSFTEDSQIDPEHMAQAFGVSSEMMHACVSALDNWKTQRPSLTYSEFQALVNQTCGSIKEIYVARAETPGAISAEVIDYAERKAKVTADWMFNAASIFASGSNTIIREYLATITKGCKQSCIESCKRKAGTDTAKAAYWMADRLVFERAVSKKRDAKGVFSAFPDLERAIDRGSQAALLELCIEAVFDKEGPLTKQVKADMMARQLMEEAAKRHGDDSLASELSI